MIKSWLKFFRVVNFPTLPGDVFVGAATVIACYGGAIFYGQGIIFASLSSVFLYLAGLADNDIVGAQTDFGRPIPDGEITLNEARVARGMMFLLALAMGVIGGLSVFWWCTVAVLSLLILAYNRFKHPILMGLCRGVNLLSGVTALGVLPKFNAIILFAIWTLYITAVTKYSVGEELSKSKKERVGVLIGAIIYLQILALMVFALMDESISRLLIAGAMMLFLSRILKTTMKGVSAS